MDLGHFKDLGGLIFLKTHFISFGHCTALHCTVVPDETVWGQDLRNVETWLPTQNIKFGWVLSWSQPKPKRLVIYILGSSQTAGHLHLPDQDHPHHHHEKRSREESTTALYCTALHCKAYTKYVYQKLKTQLFSNIFPFYRWLWHYNMWWQEISDRFDCDYFYYLMKPTKFNKSITRLQMAASKSFHRLLRCQVVHIYIYLSLSNLYNYWYTVSELVPEVIAFNKAMFLFQTLRWDFISIVNPFKILSI